MENVSVKNKEKVDLVTVSGEKDILYYIGQYMGAEFAECAERNLKEDLDETRGKYELLQNELDSYGTSLESMNLLMLLWSSFFVTLRPNFHYRSYTLP